VSTGQTSGHTKARQNTHKTSFPGEGRQKQVGRPAFAQRGRDRGGHQGGEVLVPSQGKRKKKTVTVGATRGESCTQEKRGATRGKKKSNKKIRMGRQPKTREKGGCNK